MWHRRTGLFTAIATSMLLGFLYAAPPAWAGTIDTQPPKATLAEHGCGVTFEATARFDPRTSFTEADWYIQGNRGYTAFPGPGGNVTTSFSAYPAPGDYQVFVVWSGHGLAYPSPQQSPTTTFTVPERCGEPPKDPPPTPYLSTPAVKDSVAAAARVSELGGLGVCALATAGVVVGAGVIVFTAGTATPFVAGLATAAGSNLGLAALLGCGTLVAASVAAEYALAHDPPDQSFLQVPLPTPGYPPVPQPLSECGATEPQTCRPLRTAFNAYLESAHDSLVVWRQLVENLNRYNTAAGQRSASGLDLQAAVFDVLAGQLADNLATLQVDGSNLADALSQAHLDSAYNDPLSLPTLARSFHWGALRADSRTAAIFAPLGVDTAQVQATMAESLTKASSEGYSLRSWADALRLPAATGGLLAARQALSAADITLVVDALAAQQVLTVNEAKAVRQDLVQYQQHSDDYGEPGCTGPLHTDLAAVSNSAGKTFLTSAVRALESSCPGQPLVLGVSPATGPVSGGNRVTIVGESLDEGTQVLFGQQAAISPSCSRYACVAVVPPHTSGRVDVTVQSPAGSTSTSASDQYTYSAPEPNNLLTDGDFEPTSSIPDPGAGGDLYTKVSFPDRVGGWTLGPASADIHDKGGVELVPSQTAQPGSGNQFIVFGQIDEGPASGPAALSQHVPALAGHLYTLRFLLSGDVTGGPQVKRLGATLNETSREFAFDDGSFTPHAQGWVQESFTAPICTSTATVTFYQLEPGAQGAQIDDVSLADAGPTTACAPLTVTRVDPSSGPDTGGTHVIITGANLSQTTQVNFGGAKAPTFSCTPSQCDAVSPPGQGTVDVAVATQGGSSSASTADQFTYAGAAVTQPFPWTYVVIAVAILLAAVAGFTLRRRRE